MLLALTLVWIVLGLGYLGMTLMAGPIRYRFGTLWYQRNDSIIERLLLDSGNIYLGTALICAIEVPGDLAGTWFMHKMGRRYSTTTFLAL